MLSDDGKPKRIRDPVHGLIVFGEGKSDFQDETDRIAWKLLNTAEFQRLRRIKQLGFSALTYPGATHSRFSHSVGTYHLTRQLIDLINRRISQGRVRESIPVGDRKHRQRVALLAALLHDIGHGPFSHVFEAVVRDAYKRRERTRKEKEEKNRKKKEEERKEASPRNHEDWSAEIVASADTDVHKVLEESPSCGDDSPRLYEQIVALLKTEEQGDIYSAVVSSQFDADRLDYMQRDRLMTGVQSSHIDLDWIIDCLDVGGISRADGLMPCLYINRKGIESAVEYLRARNDLYRRVYFHKATRAAEVMLRELLIRAAKTFDRISESDSGTLDDADKRLLCDPVLRYLSSASPSVASYIELDDDVVSSTVTTLASSPDHNLSCLAKRVRERKLYKSVDVDMTEDELRRRIREEQRSGLNDQDVLFDRASSKLYEGTVDEEDMRKKILVRRKGGDDSDDPVDITEDVRDIKSEKEVMFRRAYVPERKLQCELEDLIKRRNKED